jgi:3-dehydroquinate synthetase
MALPLSPVRYCNAFIRVFNVFDAIKQNNLSRIVFEVAAFSALFFPHGLAISIGIDCISELENLYASIVPLDRKTMSRERALNFFNLTEERVKDDLDNKHKTILEELEKRKKGVPIFFANQVANIIEETEVAYNVLKQPLNGPNK